MSEKMCMYDHKVLKILFLYDFAIVSVIVVILMVVLDSMFIMFSFACY